MGDSDLKFEPSFSQRAAGVRRLNPDTTYLWTATWGSEFQLTVREGGVGGPVIYDRTQDTSGTYNPSPHAVVSGSERRRRESGRTPARSTATCGWAIARVRSHWARPCRRRSREQAIIALAGGTVQQRQVLPILHAPRCAGGNRPQHPPGLTALRRVGLGRPPCATASTAAREASSARPRAGRPRRAAPRARKSRRSIRASASSQSRSRLSAFLTSDLAVHLVQSAGFGGKSSRPLKSETSARSR